MPALNRDFLWEIIKKDERKPAHELMLICCVWKPPKIISCYPRKICPPLLVKYWINDCEWDLLTGKHKNNVFGPPSCAESWWPSEAIVIRLTVATAFQMWDHTVADSTGIWGADSIEWMTVLHLLVAMLPPNSEILWPDGVPTHTPSLVRESTVIFKCQF